MSDHYTYRVTWSAEDGEHMGLCLEFPSLSWLAATLDEAFSGIRELVQDVVADMRANGEPLPTPLTERSYSGRSARSADSERRRELLRETDRYLAELIEEVGEPSPEEVAEAEAWCDRIERHLNKAPDA